MRQICGIRFTNLLKSFLQGGIVNEITREQETC